MKHSIMFYFFCLFGLFICLVPVQALSETISGTIIDFDTEAPVNGVTVILVEETSQATYQGQSNGAGEFSINNVPAGSYSLIAEKNGYEPYQHFDPIILETGIPVTLTLEMTSITGSTNETVTGTIMDAETQHAIEGVMVKLIDAHQTFQGQSDASGSFTITNVPPASYTLSAEKNGYEPYHHTHPVEIASGAATNIPIRMKLSTNAIGDPPDYILANSPRLNQNYPNPFNPTTTIPFFIPAAQKIQLSIYNSNGQFIRQLANGLFRSGQHEIRWNGTNASGQRVASGIYFSVLKSNRRQQIRSLLLIQ